jgi:endonuclease/exonuclease/phosphatase family metal-dependent hydrolase
VELDVVNTHLGLVPHEQRAQAEALVGAQWMSHADCADPAILLGDFNATPHHGAYRRIVARLRDAQAGRRRRWPTFPSRFPMLRIDHVFLSRSIAVTGAHAPKGALTRAASDHLPLVIDFRIDPGR